MVEMPLSKETQDYNYSFRNIEDSLYFRLNLKSVNHQISLTQLLMIVVNWIILKECDHYEIAVF